MNTTPQRPKPRIATRATLGALLTLTLCAPATLAAAAAETTNTEPTTVSETAVIGSEGAPLEASAVDASVALTPLELEPISEEPRDEVTETGDTVLAPEASAHLDVATEPAAQEHTEQIESAEQAGKPEQAEQPMQPEQASEHLDAAGSSAQFSFGTRDFIFTVTDDAGESVSGAVVEFYTPSGDYAGKTGLADALGTAFVNDVKPGAYFIKIDAPAARQDLVRTEWWLNASTMGEATPVTVTAGATQGYLIELNTKPTLAPGSISGTVYDASGRPIPRASVTLEHNAGSFPNYMHQTFANDQGEYRFEGIAFDDWAVKVRRTGYASGYYGSANGQYLEAVTLSAAAPAATGIDVVLAAEGITISGAVSSGHNGAVIGSGRVFLRTEPGGEVLAETLIQYDGRFRFEQVPPSASYYVSAIGGGADSYLTEGWWQAGSGEPAPIIVSDAPDQAFTADIELPLRPVIAIDDGYTTSLEQPLAITDPALGVLANDDGTPALTAEIVAPPSGGAVELFSDGTFSYTPAPGFAGVDTFTYRATGPYAASANVATVRVTVKESDALDPTPTPTPTLTPTPTSTPAPTETPTPTATPDSSGNNNATPATAPSTSVSDATLPRTGAVEAALGWAVALGVTLMAAGALLTRIRRTTTAD